MNRRPKTIKKKKKKLDEKQKQIKNDLNEKYQKIRKKFFIDNLCILSVLLEKVNVI